MAYRAIARPIELVVHAQVGMKKGEKGYTLSMIHTLTR
jgi:hypothetical protein